MPQLSIPEWTSAKLVGVTPREEFHGDDMVVAVTMRFRIKGHNEMIDQFDPTLRRAIFAGKDELAGIRALPGVEEPTPHLRHRVLEGIRHKLSHKTEGATIHIDYGIEGDVAPITCGDAKADKVSVAGYDGGSSDVEFNVGTSDVDRTELGIICAQLGSEFPIKIIAPKEQPTAQTTDAASDPRQPTLDGTTGAEVCEPSDARKAADAAFEGNPGSEGMDPNAMRAFPGAVDGDDDGQDAGDHVAGDVQRNGEDATAKTQAQIRAAKGAATRKPRAAAGA